MGKQEEGGSELKEEKEKRFEKKGNRESKGLFLEDLNASLFLVLFL